MSCLIALRSFVQVLRLAMLAFPDAAVPVAHASVWPAVQVRFVQWWQRLLQQGRPLTQFSVSNVVRVFRWLRDLPMEQIWAKQPLSQGPLSWLTPQLVFDIARVLSTKEDYLVGYFQRDQVHARLFTDAVSICLDVARRTPRESDLATSLEMMLENLKRKYPWYNLGASHALQGSPSSSRVSSVNW